MSDEFEDPPRKKHPYTVWFEAEEWALIAEEKRELIEVKKKSKRRAGEIIAAKTRGAIVAAFKK